MKKFITLVLATTLIGSLAIAPAAEKVDMAIEEEKAVVYQLKDNSRYSVDFQSTETAQNSSIRTRVH